LAVFSLSTAFSACNFLIEGTHSVAVPHQVEATPALNPEDYITVNSQEELERAIFSMVLTRQESGLFRIPHLQADALELMNAALYELRQRPLVAYAVSMFLPQNLSDRHGVTEIELVISYEKTAEQIAGVRAVNSPSVATALLGQMLRNGETYLAMLSPTNIANVSFLETIIWGYYYSQALEVVVLPRVAISLYPSAGTGNQRIAEVVLDFGVDPYTLVQMRDDLFQAATELLDGIPEDRSPAARIIWLAEALSGRVSLVSSEDAPADLELYDLLPICHTAFGALVMGQASSEGIAMAFQALLELLGFEAQVVRGELEDLPHAWNMLSFEAYYYHIDVSMLAALGPETTLFVPDEVMMFQNGYSWDTVQYPRADSPLRFDDF